MRPPWSFKTSVTSQNSRIFQTNIYLALLLFVSFPPVSFRAFSSLIFYSSSTPRPRKQVPWMMVMTIL
jgi:hypothetical protein